ncbi:eukaryotic translation initiation factor eIF2A-domain-containing protein [Myxozyma melibiosi]|uniref:Eukaryotic translation initiation factor 2A n=1 Tax=Myxozyma melibiosi TaxID=54550 RepID=A0ABR1F7A7_9ASCO
MSSIPQLFYRTSKTIGLIDSAPRYAEVSDFQKPSGTTRTCRYSPFGGLFAYTTVESVVVVESSTGRSLQTIELANVYELAFSPKGTYLLTWERPLKVESGQPPHANLKIFEVATGNNLAQFVQKAQTMALIEMKIEMKTYGLLIFLSRNFQFTYDEKFCARLVPNELQFFETSKLGSPSTQKLNLDGIASFALSPGNSYNVAVFVPELKGKPALVNVYNAPSFAKPLSSKSLFKAEKVVLKWNKLGTSLIVWSQTEVDQTGKSYYGESNLYLRGIAGNFDCRIDLDKEGPIHDVAWSPDSREFAVVYGYMPAKTMIFNNRGETIRTLPLGPRNTILYSPHGKYLIVAGFGNLQGEVNVYDRLADFKKVATIDGSNTSVCEWSPDGQYLMFATCSPRLRVDNGVKIFHVSGKLVYVNEMAELFAASWRPEPAETYPLRSADIIPEAHASAALVEVKAPVKAAGAYRPPHARGSATPLHFKREDEGGLAFSPQDSDRLQKQRDEMLSKSALKNKKKREAKKAKEDADKAQKDAAPTTSPTASSNATAEASPVAPPPGLSAPKNGMTFENPQDEKKYRGLMKKLRAIEDLKMRQAAGEKLEDTQLAKIKTEDTVKKDLTALGWTE